jgi:rhodanese-related sulfurtransferase
MAQSFLLSIICFFIFFAVNAQNNYNEVTLPELMKKLQEKDTNMIIVDVRTKGEYYDTSSRFQQMNIGHIKGAINIPLQDFRKDPATVHQLDAYKEKDIYVICSHSYRSRVVSNILLDSGFTRVNNTRGGMTEFFRRYSELAPFKNDFYETNIQYKNIAPAQLLEQLSGNKNPLLISISNTPKFFWDSLNLVFYKYYPSFKNAVNFNYADSLKILELVQKEKNRRVVLFNTTNYGAAELAGWLTQKGMFNVAYLVGGADLFYEYVLNENLTSIANKFLMMHSGIHFMTPSLFCDQMAASKNTRIIDLRHDTLFNKITKGAKYNYKHLRDAINFFADKGIQEFEQQFPDKKTEYIFISENGIVGLELADSLAKKGYKINWITGGLQRWEWYMNNVETFKCMDYLVN